MWKVGTGGKILFVAMGVAILAYTADRYVAHGQLLRAVSGEPAIHAEISLLDFPAGAAAAVDDLASIPSRPVRVAALPRGSTATLLLTSDGPGFRKEAPASRAFGVDLELTLLQEEGALLDVLRRGGDNGGADAIVLSVDRLALLAAELREARPQAVLLISRPRGYEVIAAAAGIDQVPALKGKRIAVPEACGALYFLTWRLAQALLHPSSVEIVPAASSAEAARLFRESKVDAAVGLAPDFVGPVRELGGAFVASTADAPHLLAHVLVFRGDFIARYPDAPRRLARAVLDRAELLAVDPTEGARALARHEALVAEALNPFTALKLDPPATLAENLAFFGIRGDTPVRFADLYASALKVWRKLGKPIESFEDPLPVSLDPLEHARANPPTVPAKPPARPPEPPKPVQTGPEPSLPAIAPDAGIDEAAAPQASEETATPEPGAAEGATSEPPASSAAP
ncbi:MAG: ABC transporter substrate-binding protein [Myxococcales bacterium]|jgi:ABC-type nitrate/sulfonate/bicarbonate transport system substrate-binding protein